MEKETLHRAADTITQLLRAHVTEGAVDVDIHEAMADRDDLRELAYSLDGPEFDVPEVGDEMFEGACPVDVVEVTDYTAQLYHIENGDGPSVAQYESNEEYSPDAPVVKVTYPGGDKPYPMPVDRLSRSPQR